MARNVDNEPLYQPLNVTKTLNDKQSLVSKYKTLIVTSGEEQVGPKRIFLIFKVIDEVTGQLGVFKELFLEVRKELVEAIFTDSIHPGFTNDPEEVKRIPYMEALKQLAKDQKYKEDDFNTKVEKIERKLFEKQQAFEEQLEKNEDLSNECQERDAIIADLRQQLEDMERQKDLLEKEFDLFKRTTEKRIQDMTYDYQDLQEELRIVTADRDLCKPFKEGYDRMQIEFQNIGLKAYEDTRAEHQKPTPLSQKEKLIADVKAAIKLQDQLLKGQNLLIQEYDAFLEKHKSDIRGDAEAGAEGRASALSDPSFRHFEAEAADHQLLLHQKRFHENIERVDNEMNLLGKHQMMLEEQLLGMLKAGEGHADSVLELLRGISNAGEGAADTYVQGDPFVVNERVFSKYSLMLFVSTNGAKTFSECGGSNYCHQCFEKTTVCPHKLRGKEIVIPLPTNASHLRLNRPEVKIDKSALHQSLHELRLLERKSGLPPLPSRLSSKSKSSLSTGVTQDTEKEQEQDSRFQNKFSRVWEDYNQRTELSRQHPILQSKNLVESLIEQFYATCLWDDEYTPDDEEGYSVLDNFFEFLYSRYLNEDIVFLVAYDFFVSLQNFADSDSHLRMFSHVLCNNFDGAVFRYFLVLMDLVNQVEWRHSEDFREFLQVAFPFMLDDDIETFQIGFVAFCENRVSRQSVYDYLMYSILRYRDPFFLEMESKCMQSPMAELGCMTEREFQSVSETVCDNSLDHVARRLFLEAAAAAEREVKTPQTVPVAKVSHILSYLSILQLQASARQELPGRIEQNRQKQKIELKDSQQQQQQPPIRWNHSSALHLAKCMAKSEQFRQQMSAVE